MNFILLFLSWLAVAGLLSCVAVHWAWLLKIYSPSMTAVQALSWGLFVVWLPAVLMARRLSRGSVDRNHWRVVFNKVPPWMKKITIASIVYSLANFFIVLWLEKFHPGADDNALTLGAIPGHLIAFYSISWAVLYAASHPSDPGQ